MPKLPDYYIPPSPSYVPPRGSLSRPSASQLDRIAKQQVDVQWSLTAFNRSFRLCYGIQVIPGWYMTRPVVNGTGNLVVAVYWSIGPIESVDQMTINSRPVPAGVMITTYLGDQVGVVDPTLAAALTGFADTYDGVAYTVYEIPPGTVEGFPSQAQFMAQVHGQVLEDNPAPAMRYWRVRATEVEHTSGRVSVSLLEFRETPGGPNVATGGTAISSTGIAANAFNGNPANEWLSNAGDTTPDAWIGYDAGAGNTISINEVWMRSANVTPATTPSVFVLEYSSDAVAWFPFFTRSANRPWEVGLTGTFTNTGVTSENPGEQLADFITNEVYGLSTTVTGADDVIAFDDELVGDPLEPRCRAGFTLWGSREGEIIDMISAHAEALWSYDGFGVLLVPDRMVDEPAAEITEDNIYRGTFRITGKGLIDSPSAISLTFTDRDNDALQWTQDSATVQDISGYETRSVVSMPGVYRETEALRKATQRLRRLSASVAFSWQHTDDAIAFQRGDVVRLPDMRGLSEQDVRVLSINQVSAGVYQISGEPYSDSYYGGALPAPTVEVPVGGIVPFFSDDDIPIGWAIYSDADGLPLRSDTANAGSNTGTTDIPQLSGTTSNVLNHTGPEFLGPGRIDYNNPVVNTRTPIPLGAHSHEYESDGPVEHTMLQVRRRLMQKTGTPAQLPANAAVFSPGQIVAPSMSAINTFIGRVFAGGDASSEAGEGATRTIGISSISNSGAHGRHEGAGLGEYITEVSFGPTVYQDLTAPNHDHGNEGSVQATVNPRRRRMAVYVASAETGISVGAVIGFDPNEALPTGWAEFDLEGYLFEISTPGNAGSDSGNDTVTWTGTTATDGAHSHKGDPIPTNTIGAYVRIHDTISGHTHQMNGAAAFVPLAHCMRFIQYTGV